MGTEFGTRANLGSHIYYSGQIPGFGPLTLSLKPNSSTLWVEG